MNLKNYLIELYKRIVSKNPKFFNWIQALGALCIAVGYLPNALVLLEITPTPLFSHVLEVALRVAGAVAIGIAQLPTPDATAKQLPFTSQNK